MTFSNKNSFPRRSLVAAAMAFFLLPLAAFAQPPVSVRAEVFTNSRSYDEEMSFAAAQVTNNTGQPQDYELDVLCRGGRITYRVAGEGLRPGETRSVFVPSLARPSQVRVKSGGGSTASSSTTQSNPPVMGLHVYSTGTKPAQAKEQAFHDLVESSRKDLLADSSLRGPSGSWRYGGATPPPLTGPACHEVSAGMAPDDWRCYAMFPVVFVSQSVWRQLERQPAGQAISRWVFTGGFLMVYDAERSGGEAVGAGTVMLASENMFDDPAAVLAKLPLAMRAQGWREFAADTWSNRGYVAAAYGSWNGGFPLSTGGEAAYGTPVALSLLFFLIAGPANFFWLRRKERIKALFITVPLFSLFFCFLITGAFFVSAGFDRRSAVVSLTCVDQASGQSLTASRFLFYSGLYPGGGFRWSNDALMLPLSLDNRSASFDLTRGLHLRGGLFEPLSEMHYVTVAPAATSEKIVVEERNGNLTLSNGFETDIEKIFVRREGKHYVAENIQRGGSAPLLPAIVGASATGSREPFAPLIDLLCENETKAEVAAMTERLVTNFYFYPDFPAGYNPARDQGRVRAERSADCYLGRFAGRPANVVAGPQSLKDAGSWCFVAGVF
jgi:hypothetical protein